MNRFQHLLALTGGLLCWARRRPRPRRPGPNRLHHQLLHQSQSISYRTPPGWPAVTVEPCCKTDWGSLPGGIDWPNGAPIMICTGKAEYATTYPELRRSEQSVAGVSPGLREPKIGIGVAWPNPKDYRYEVQTVPIIDGSDGTCAQYSNHPGKVANWWVYQLKEPKRGSYVFTATVSFEQGEKGYYAVLNNCKLAPPSSTSAGQ